LVTTLVTPLERLVTETRAEQLFGNQGVRPLDPQLAERLARMQPGDVFIIDPLPERMTPRSVKTYYNQAARVAGIHLRWRRGDDPIAAQVVAQPSSDELRAERKRAEAATRRRSSLRALTSDARAPRELNGLIDRRDVGALS
jgi:hypothetical protein